MICDAPAQNLQPPTWFISEPAASEPSIALGFVSFGTDPQIAKLADAAQQAGFRCALPKTNDGRVEIMVFFDSHSTRENAFSFYKRVVGGEFGTSDTGMMVLPASAVKKP